MSFTSTEKSRCSSAASFLPLDNGLQSICNDEEKSVQVRKRRRKRNTAEQRPFAATAHPLGLISVSTRPTVEFPLQPPSQPPVTGAASLRLGLQVATLPIRDLNPCRPRMNSRLHEMARWVHGNFYGYSNENRHVLIKLQLWYGFFSYLGVLGQVAYR